MVLRHGPGGISEGRLRAEVELEQRWAPTYHLSTAQCSLLTKAVWYLFLDDRK